MRSIETKEELIDYLTRVCATNRKSYKLYGIINKGLIITGGILGSTAVVPVISVFVATISIVPVIIGIITNATKLSDKKAMLKSHHRKFKTLLNYVQKEDTLTEQQLTKEVFKKNDDIQNVEGYPEPIEWYIRRYKLNGYDIEADEVQMIQTISNRGASKVNEPQLIK